MTTINITTDKTPTPTPAQIVAEAQRAAARRALDENPTNSRLWQPHNPWTKRGKTPHRYLFMRDHRMGLFRGRKS